MLPNIPDDTLDVTLAQIVNRASTPDPTDKVQSWLTDRSVSPVTVPTPSTASFGTRPKENFRPPLHPEMDPIDLSRVKARYPSLHSPSIIDAHLFPTSGSGQFTDDDTRDAHSPSTVLTRNPTLTRTARKKKVTKPSSERASVQDSDAIQSLIICGICRETLILVTDPLKTSLLASASSKGSRYGMSLLCPGRHIYCLDCFSTYMRVKMEESGGRSAFPMRCPECPRATEWEVDDETARKILPMEMMDVWYAKRLLSTMSNSLIYCPNPKCGEAIDTSDIILDVDKTTCPACRVEICLKCRTVWHIGSTCEDVRKPSRRDATLQELAARNQWRRCPQCRALVERAGGCNHMVCLCGAEFCFACGANYADGGCAWVGGCDGQWQNETDWTERAEETVKQQTLLSRFKRIQWLGKNGPPEGEENQRPRAWSWSKVRTFTPPLSRPDTDSSRMPGPLLALMKRLAPQDKAPSSMYSPPPELRQFTQAWRLSEDWMLIPQDGTNATAISTLAPPASARLNRRSAPPSMGSTSDSGHRRNGGSLGNVADLEDRMKPLPPLPPAATTEDAVLDS